MRKSKFLFLTKKDVTSEARLVSHKLMLRSGMVKQVSSGVYAWLPLGLKVLKKIKNIIREELDEIDGNEIALPSLQKLSIWEKSGRAIEESDMKSQIFHLIDCKKSKYVLPPSGEEEVTNLYSDFLQSYKNLGKMLYQITWKFRDEIRPKHGVMRCKEFLMKDAYTFDATKEKALEHYEKIFNAYLRIFKKIGVDVIPVLAPTGAMGGDYSHEFHILANEGESRIYYQNDLFDYLNEKNICLEDFGKLYAKEEEKHDKDAAHNDDIVSSKSIEVGHMFYLGTKYSKALECTYTTEDGKIKHPEMGCYGIGISRLVAAVIENSHDEKGIIWPESISPFRIMLINLNIENQKCVELSEKIYSILGEKYEILYDDSKNSIGKKLNDADLIGISWQIIVGPRFANDDKVELKNRKASTAEIVDLSEIINKEFN
ncbi:MAG: prolyl-tRNA synthetase [Candidatus Midichloriaceae bacterium]|jgi:prolyl-tRNA synthetase